MISGLAEADPIDLSCTRLRTVGRASAANSTYFGPVGLSRALIRWLTDTSFPGMERSRVLIERHWYFGQIKNACYCHDLLSVSYGFRVNGLC